MIYSIIAAVIVILALILCFFTCKMLAKSSWFLGWLRGMCGLLFLGSVVFLAFLAADVFSYKQLTAEQPIATIRFSQLSHQHYQASFIDSDGVKSEYELFGDQWQLDSRVIKWTNTVLGMGIKPGYRLDRIAGRYLSLDDERNKPRKVYGLNQNIAGVDVWLWLNQADDNINLIDARYGSGVFLPMVDKGHYQILLSSTGLIARPLNQEAKDAVALWQ